MEESYFENRIRAMAAATSRGVVGALMWWAPNGQMWIAPLGSSPPRLGGAMPPEWLPVKRLEREEVELP